MLIYLYLRDSNTGKEALTGWSTVWGPEEYYQRTGAIRLKKPIELRVLMYSSAAEPSNVHGGNLWLNYPIPPQLAFAASKFIQTSLLCLEFPRTSI